LCKTHDKENKNEHIFDKRRKRANQKARERRRKTIQQTNSIYDKFLHNKQKVGEEKMNKKDELYWGDRERIRRAEEMREKNEKTRVSH
jgi:hypothetical protein